MVDRGVVTDSKLLSEVGILGDAWLKVHGDCAEHCDDSPSTYLYEMAVYAYLGSAGAHPERMQRELKQARADVFRLRANIDALRRRVELRYRDKDIDRYFAQALDGETELELLT